MAKRSPPTPEEMARQAQQHIESLRAAGVEWAGRSPPPAPIEPEPARPSGALFAGLVEEAPEPKIEAAPELDIDQRRRELTVLAERVAGCTRCPALVSTRRQTVFGVGPLSPPLCFVGEAPGADEDARGEPFVGAAGQLLNRIIAACGMKREEVYICNILRCRPPGNRTPAADEVANCREHLERQLELVRPQYICCLGAVAAQNLLGTSQSIGRLRGNFQNYRGIPVLCTYHPSYLLRIEDEQKRNDAKRMVWEDMKKLLTRMGRPIPQAGGGAGERGQ
jgi:DNA polymerase